MLFHRVIGDDRRVSITFLKPSRTKQAFKDVSNINNILAKHARTGVVDHYSRFQGSYGDFTAPSEYQECINKVMEAKEMFMTLPSSIRKRFDNDPASFLEFVQDESNRDEAISLGLVKPKVVEDVAPPAPPKEA